MVDHAEELFAASSLVNIGSCKLKIHHCEYGRINAPIHALQYIPSIHKVF